MWTTNWKCSSPRAAATNSVIGHAKFRRAELREAQTHNRERRQPRGRFFTTKNSGTINPAPLSGNTVAILDGGQNPMFQSFPTVPGITYEVDWGMRLPDLGGNGVPIVGDSTTGPGELNVNLNGQFVQDLVQNRSTWNFYAMDFVATETSSQLSFSIPEYIWINNNFQRSASIFLDNVSAIAVPEPSVCGMLLVGSVLLVRRQVSGRYRMQ